MVEISLQHRAKWKIAAAEFFAILAIILPIIVPTAHAAITFVQVAAATPQTPTQVVSIPYPATQTAGNLNIVVVGWNDAAATVQSVRDSAGNPYNLAIGPTSGTGLRQSIYFMNNISGSSNTITVTFSKAANYPDIRILEYGGVGILDKTAGASGSGTSSSSGSVTTTAANELIFAANTVSTGTSGPGAGFTNRIITSPDSDIAEDRIVSAIGTYNATAPLTSSGNWVMQMATFAAQFGGAAPSISGVSPNSGPTGGGTAVTITGSNFASGATVTFGGNSATNVTAVSGTSIAATTPAGAAGVVSVSVTNPNGQSGSLASGFIYISPTAPSVSSVAPGSGPTGGCTAVTITGTNFASGATVTFGGNSATNVTVVSSSSITAVTPTGAAGSVDVAVTNPNGQNGTLVNAFTYTDPLPAYPLKVSSNGRYLVDQNNKPFMIVGDSPQGLIVDLSISEADTFFANRQMHGFNAMWIHLLGGPLFSGRSDGSTYDGILPFTTVGDLSTLNEDYFARADAMINLAARHGITVFLNPAETIDWLSTLKNNGTAKCRAYGQYLGNRYKNFDNLAWFYGNDFQTWSTPEDDAVVMALRDGIADTDTRHIHSIMLNYLVSGSRDDPNWETRINLSCAYTYYPTYAKVLDEYNRTPSMPVFLGEANYEGESLRGYLTTPNVVRRQEYWAMTSGATGSFYGSYWTWGFRSGWQSNYDSTGSAEIGYFRDLFSSRPWWKLVPDQNHTVLTAGYGTYVSNGDYTGTNDFATAALASDSSCMIAYLPTSRQITVDLTRISGTQVNAWWYNPSTGTATSIGTFSNTGSMNFTPPAAGDWVIVLDDAGRCFPPPTVSRVSPASGPANGGTAVTITGTDFTAGATVTFAGIPATNVVVVNSSSISATTPPGPLGAVDVMVINSDGQDGSLALGYYYTGSPSIGTVSPASGPANGGTAVTIAGANFASGASVKFGVNGATNVSVISSTSIAATTPSGTAGTVNVTVTNPDGQVGTLTGGFTYLSLPLINIISPGSGPVIGGTAVTITGSNFASGATVKFGGNIAANATVVSSTSITATTPGGVAGAVSVTVTNPDGRSGTIAAGYTYTAAPTLGSVSPASGPVSGGTSVALTGTNFMSGAAVAFAGNAATNVTVVNSTTITARTPARPAGPVSVAVTNPDGQIGTLSAGFTYTAAPGVNSISPTSGPMTGGTAVTITGANFASGATVTFGGNAATNVTVASSTSITARTPAGAAGAVSVIVTNPDGQIGTLSSGFTYAAAPTVSGVLPGSGPVSGGTLVTISGANFLSGAAVTFGGNAATNVTVVSSTSITARTPAGAAGAVSITVTNPDGQNGTLTGGFTYSGSAAISFVQVAAATPQGRSRTVVVSYASSQTAGDLNIVVVGWNDTNATVQSVQDSAGNTYSLAIGPTSGTGIRQSIYYAQGVVGGNNTITVTFSRQAAYPDIRILEYSGVGTLDKTAGLSGRSSTSSSGSVTTTTANELIFGANTVSTFTSGPGTGFTSRIITAQDGEIAEDRIVNATGTYSATASLVSSGYWVMQVATFK